MTGSTLAQASEVDPSPKSTEHPAQIHFLGENALVLNAGAQATLSCQQRLWVIAANAAKWAHVLEVVPGMNNLTILFDPLILDADMLADRVLTAWNTGVAVAKSGRQIEIPVAYGGEGGPDLRVVADHTGLSIADVIKRHTAADYVVFFLGFQPGFAYMGGLDSALATPRRREPRLVVPAGSVAIGGSQTAIYPASSPGGWQLIGHSTVRLFDPFSEKPTLLQPGDHVRFVATKGAS
ncbi:5-oxoprolinase subunit PxpB [Glaciimonas immobilis]|uniref:KipI family sensor histidine kinase inhibitor n=1 Tax=Glaciimonas immobilis TaxID=728004 RepID=A0A840RSW4_9BURK|nr:5-oxoprolinase subunit PxpB [Glaciimonas immobilis]KAF3997175.1 5-oxoprolinase subunit PxpB [Glaciimonas immobilis]MBB5200046.1 KipI family sensor histidine kinase inhibitor [Glaciimonas immobilis]